MLKVDLNSERGDGSIEFSGNIATAISDTTFVIKDVYKHFSRKNALDGELFQIGIKALIMDDDSPVWKDEEEKDGIKSVEIKLPDGFKMPGDE